MFGGEVPNGGTKTADRGERSRIAAAMVEVVGRRGFARATLEAVLDASGLSERAFYRHFADLEDCFVQVWDELTLQHAARAAAVYERPGPWHDRMRAVAWETLRYLREDEDRARFLVLEVLNAGEIAQAHRDLVIAGEARWVDDGRHELADPSSVPRSVADHVVGAINELLIRNTMSGEIFKGDQYVRELMYLAVRPYLGHAEALKELTMPAPPQLDQHG
jgi:AcrR family transcriptional regulator